MQLKIKKEFLEITKWFLLWRIGLFIILIGAVEFVPLFGNNFLGGGLENYIKNPYFFAWANFDGEHYLSIAMFGYKNLQQAFFPAYPILISSLSHLFDTSLESNLWSGLIVSNVLFLGCLFLFWKIIKLDFSEKIANISIILLLLFPTSFYFGAVYTESLFLFTSLLTYYLYRKQKYFLSGFVGVLMTMTRIYGLLVILMILVDIIRNKLTLIEIIKKKIYLVGISVSGIIVYMWYLLKYYSDPFVFYNLQTLVGEQRSLNLILLPQVFYRYVIKIIPNLTWNYSPIVFTTLLELGTALLFLTIIVFSFKKIRWDYWTYMLLGYLIPTLTGSFSSLPRYVSVLFPAFIVLATSLEKTNKYLRLGIYITLSIIAVAAQMLFFRGYFVS